MIGIENKSGTWYQAALNDDEQKYIYSLLAQLHNGGIKVLRNKLPFEPSKKK